MQKSFAVDSPTPDLKSIPSREATIVAGAFYERGGLIALAYVSAIVFLLLGIVESPASWWFLAIAGLSVLSTHFWRFAHRNDPELRIRWDGEGLQLLDAFHGLRSSIKWKDVQTVHFRDSFGFNTLPCAMEFTDSEGASRLRVPLAGLSREDQKALWAAIWINMDRPANYVRVARTEERIGWTPNIAKVASLTLLALFVLVVIMGEEGLGIQFVSIRTSIFILFVSQLQLVLPHATVLNVFLPRPRREALIDEWRLRLEAASRTVRSLPPRGIPFTVRNATGLLSWVRRCRRFAMFWAAMALAFGGVAAYRLLVLNVDFWRWGIYAALGILLGLWSMFQFAKFQSMPFTDDTLFRRASDSDVFEFWDDNRKWRKVPGALWDKLIQHPMIQSQIEPMPRLQADADYAEPVAETVSESL